jgi:hypothetical protein
VSTPFPNLQNDQYGVQGLQTNTPQVDPETDPAFTNPTGLKDVGNLDIYKRPKLQNADGSVSTVRSMSFEENGKEVLVPTVGPKGEDWNNQQAIEHYKKTGEHLGKFDTPDNADKYAEALHRQQEQYYTKNNNVPRSTMFSRLQGTARSSLMDMLGGQQ